MNTPVRERSVPCVAVWRLRIEKIIELNREIYACDETERTIIINAKTRKATLLAREVGVSKIVFNKSMDKLAIRFKDRKAILLSSDGRSGGWSIIVDTWLGVSEFLTPASKKKIQKLRKRRSQLIEQLESYSFEERVRAEKELEERCRVDG